MEHYLPILRSLVGASVRFAVIGTWALRVYFPEKMAAYILHDCDIVLAPDLENIQLAIQALRENGWDTQIWGDGVDANITLDDLLGKYYVRAKTGNLHLDLTYECMIPWEKMEAGMTLRLGIPLASEADIWALRQAKFNEQGIEDPLIRTSF